MSTNTGTIAANIRQYVLSLPHGEDVDTYDPVKHCLVRLAAEKEKAPAGCNMKRSGGIHGPLGKSP